MLQEVAIAGLNDSIRVETLKSWRADYVCESRTESNLSITASLAALLSFNSKK